MTVDPAVRELLDAFEDGDAFDVARPGRRSTSSASLAAPGPGAATRDATVAGVRVRDYARSGGRRSRWSGSTAAAS